MPVRARCSFAVAVGCAKRMMMPTTLQQPFSTSAAMAAAAVASTHYLSTSLNKAKSLACVICSFTKISQREEFGCQQAAQRRSYIVGNPCTSIAATWTNVRSSPRLISEPLSSSSGTVSHAMFGSSPQSSLDMLSSVCKAPHFPPESLHGWPKNREAFCPQSELGTPLHFCGVISLHGVHVYAGSENSSPLSCQKLAMANQPCTKSKMKMLGRLNRQISTSKNIFSSDGPSLVSDLKVETTSTKGVASAGAKSSSRDGEVHELLKDAEIGCNFVETFHDEAGHNVLGLQNGVGLEASESDALKPGIAGTETCSSSKARGQGERRQRGGGSLAQHDGNFHDLLTVPGIGSKNMEKLMAKGIKRLVELKQLYRDKFLGDECDKMVEYLRSSVGIVHRNHACSIAAFIKSTVDEELKDETSNKQGMHLQNLNDRLTFCVEGNISVGKTTFLQRIANETLELRDLVEVVPEPIEKWQNVGPDGFNILNAFYAEPERYAYTFQNYVFVTRLMQERESANGVKPLRLMERSVFSDRMVFVRAVHEAKWMNEMEISIYDSWFDPVVSQLPGLVPDGFIYLRASPDTCLKRLLSRKRPEENSVSLEYLQGLHEKHEQWLFPAKRGSADFLSIRKWPTGLKEPPSALIRDRVFYLEGDHVHSSLHKVPALVLDCENSIDFNRDLEAKAEYARQVAEFRDYVKRTKHIIGGQTTGVVRQPAGVLGPDGHLLRANMTGADLRKKFSSFCS